MYMYDGLLAKALDHKDGPLAELFFVELRDLFDAIKPPPAGVGDLPGVTSSPIGIALDPTVMWRYKGLSEEAQKAARRLLKKHHILRETVAPPSPLVYMRLDLDRYNEVIDRFLNGDQ